MLAWTSISKSKKFTILLTGNQDCTMMTPSEKPLEIRVPANFGLKNLERPFHSNITLTLKEGGSYRANSMILSYNSPVFERLFLELNQTVLDVQDFSPDLVRSFVKALYVGCVQLDTQQFREMRKLGRVYGVDWVQRRCREFWVGLLESVDSESPYSTLQFLLDEAQYAKSALKEPSYIDDFIKKISGLENRVEVFIQPYLVDYYALNDSQLDLAIQVAKPDPSCILKIIKTNAEKQGFVFDQSARYFLNNLNLCLCIEQDGELFEEVVDILTEPKTNLPNKDVYDINKLYRSTLREQLKRVKESKLAAEADATAAKRQCMLPTKNAQNQPGPSFGTAVLFGTASSQAPSISGASKPAFSFGTASTTFVSSTPNFSFGKGSTSTSSMGTVSTQAFSFCVASTQARVLELGSDAAPGTSTNFFQLKKIPLTSESTDPVPANSASTSSQIRKTQPRKAIRRCK